MTIREKLEKYEIPTYIKRRFWLEKAPHLTKKEIDETFDTLKDFLFLSSLKPVYLSSYIVDEAWHTFILFTREYFDFCNEVFGKYMHHAPSTSKRGFKDDKKEILDTYSFAKKTLGNDNLFTIDKRLKIKGSEYKGIIEIKNGNVFLNGKKI